MLLLSILRVYCCRKFTMDFKIQNLFTLVNTNSLANFNFLSKYYYNRIYGTSRINIIRHNSLKKANLNSTLKILFYLCITCFVCYANIFKHTHCEFENLCI